MLIILFAVQLQWLPSGGYVPFTEDLGGWLASATLPAISLALLQMGLLARITRSTMLEVLRQDYIRTAEAKGMPPWIVVGKHALKNVMIPVITVVGIIFSLLLGGSVVIETIYSIPGVGRLMGSAILRRDYPVIQGGMLFIAGMLVFINLVVDVLYAFTNLPLIFISPTSPICRFIRLSFLFAVFLARSVFVCTLVLRGHHGSREH
jgi:peptide/nickel transport system permease protein